VLVKLTRDGEAFLHSLSFHHLEELQSTGPKFVKILQRLIEIDELADTEKPPQAKPRSARHKPGKETKHG